MNGATRNVRAVSDDLEAAGLRARIIARDIDSGAQVSLAPDGLVPLASVAKVPIALAVLTRISDGVVAADDLIRVEPAEADSASPTG
ncbi:MAG TPA: serine hydrolase, partial [Brevibacterium sp.]|nr:serine hydrolase [Brevibacterium sp.]